jgi:two-component system OmpR family sensor kinase
MVVLTAAVTPASRHRARRRDAAELILSQRAFVADASHQLRTPLTALRLRLENLESDATDESSAAELADAIGETERLGVLVGDLLHLARAERAAAPVAVDLSQLVGLRVDLWGASAEEVDVELVLEGPTDIVEVLATPGGVEQVIDNQLDNAIRAARRGTAVTVWITSGSDEHRVSVGDQGPGLRDAD